MPPLRLRLRGDCSVQSDTSGACQRGWSSARNRSRTDVLDAAYAFANSLAGTLMVAIIIFRAGDGTLSVTPCNEFDGDAEVVAEIDPFDV